MAPVADLQADGNFGFHLQRYAYSFRDKANTLTWKLTLFTVSHCIMDATYQARFLADLNDAVDLSQPQSLRPHASYKLLAESYYSLLTTPNARRSI
jgi:hypothetical protein